MRRYSRPRHQGESSTAADVGVTVRDDAALTPKPSRVRTCCVPLTSPAIRPLGCDSSATAVLLRRRRRALSAPCLWLTTQRYRPSRCRCRSRSRVRSVQQSGGRHPVSHSAAPRPAYRAASADACPTACCHAPAKRAWLRTVVRVSLYA